MFIFDKGVFLLPDLIEPPFVQSSIPAFPRHNDRMAYVYVTDYLANSGWYAALRNNKLQFSIDENSVFIIHISCFKWIYSVKFNHIFLYAVLSVILCILVVLLVWIIYCLVIVMLVIVCNPYVLDVFSS